MSGGPDHPVVKDPLRSSFLAFPEGARLVEPTEGSLGVTFPRGFVAAGVAAGIKESGRVDLGMVAITPDYAAGAVGAGVFTRNSFAAAPVVVSRRETALGSLSAVVMNSGNANAVTGAPGLAVARAMQAAAAQALGLPVNRVGVGSTGVIGQPLDGAKVVAGIQAAAGKLTAEGGPAFAQAIMTTDRFPKGVRARGLDARRRGPHRRGGQGRGHDRSGLGDDALRGHDRRGAVGVGRAQHARARGRAHVQPHLGRRADEHQRHGLPAGERRLGRATLGRWGRTTGRGVAGGVAAARADDGRRRRRGHQGDAAPCPRRRYR